MSATRSSSRLNVLLCAGLMAVWVGGVGACGPGPIDPPPQPDAGFSLPQDDGGTVPGEDGGTSDAGEEPGEDGGTDAGEEDGGTDAGDDWPFPETTLLSGPSGTVTTDSATFTFTANDPRHHFECSLDQTDWDPCSSPATYSGLVDGAHVFEVRALSPDGAWFDETPAIRTWRIETGPGTPTVIRVMAANITSGNYQAYTLGHGVRIFQGLEPDIVAIQEFNYGSNTDAAIRDFVDLAFGPEFHYSRQSGVQIPNGIISRYPIIEEGVWDDPEVNNRDFSWARIDVPGPIDLWVVSVHFLTTSAAKRSAEATALVNRINQQVPLGDYLVIAGDFNTDSRSEAAISRLSQVVVTSTAVSPYPVDQNGNGNTNASRSKPYDWVLADDDLAPKEVPLVMGTSTYPYGLVFDSRVYTPLSDVSPVLAGDSGAPSMQHMAVMKAYQLP